MSQRTIETTLYEIGMGIMKQPTDPRQAAIKMSPRGMIRYCGYWIAIAAATILATHHIGRAGYINAEDAARSAVEITAEVLVSRINSDLIDTDNVLEIIIRGFKNNAEKAIAANHLNELALFVPSSSAIRIFNNKGGVVGSSIYGEGKFSISDREFFKLHGDLNSSSTIYSEVLVGKVTGLATIYASKSLYDINGTFQGVALVAYNISTLHTLFKSIGLPDKSVIVMRRLDNGAAVIRVPGDIAVDNKPAYTAPIRIEILSGSTSGTTHIKSPEDGVDRIYAYKAVGKFPFFIAAVLAESDYLQSTYHQKITLIIISTCFLLIVGLVLWRLARKESNLVSALGALEESEDRYHSIFSHSMVPNILVDPANGTIVDANLAAASFYGWDTDVLKSMNISKINTLTRDEIAAEMKAANDEKRSHFYFRHRLNGGDVRDVEVYSGPIDISGRHLLLSLVHDITDGKAAEAAKQRAEVELHTTLARLNLVLKTAGEGIIGIDDENRVMFATPAAARILGWATPEEMIAKPLHDAIGHVQADGCSSCLSKTCRIRGVQRDGCEVRVLDEFFTQTDGTIIPIEYVVSPLVVNDDIVGAVVAFHDITDRMVLESKLKQTNAELEQFTYMVSHDLRAPLRSVMSFLGLIERRIGKELPQDILEFIGFAVDGAKQLDHLILDLLEFSRSGKGKELVAIPLEQAISHALSNLEVPIQEAKAEVIVTDTMPSVMGDTGELVRLFQNLIGNAIKYVPSDRTPRVEVAWRKQNENILLWIKDNGIGIAPENHDRAFKVFQRLVTNEQYDGTGIGLAICKKIVEHHGGKIWIESDVGVGSTFFVTLPIAM